MTGLSDGVRIVCPTCRGLGRIEEPKRALLRSNPHVHTLVVERLCRPCEGTGWIPPKHDPDPDGSEDADEG